jgi:GNAT superfamily N-acetyltransferase
VELAAGEITLRLAGAEDTGFLCAVYASTRETELAITGWTDAQKAAFCRMQFDAQDRHYRTYYSTAEFLIVSRDAAPVGRLYVDRWESEIRVMDITILPAFRGQGIGGYLLQQLQREAAVAGKPLTIHVEPMNPARRLYERMGFRLKEDKGFHLLLEWRAEMKMTNDEPRLS